MTEHDTRRRRRSGLLLLLAALIGTAIALLLATLAPAAGTFDLRMTLTPAAVTLAPGESADFRIALLRGAERGTVTFATGELPPGTTATFSVPATTGDEATLTLRTDATATPVGDYDVVVRGQGSGVIAGALVRLKVGGRTTARAADIKVSGSPALALRPGTSAGIDVTLTNPGALPVRVATVNLAVTAVRAPAAGSATPCTVADFTVSAYQGPAVLVPAGATRTLSQLGVAARDWPTLTMSNTSRNQDGCKGAALTLAFSASGRTP